MKINLKLICLGVKNYVIVFYNGKGYWIKELRRFSEVINPNTISSEIRLIMKFLGFGFTKRRCILMI